jgi:hypothetical protein
MNLALMEMLKEQQNVSLQNDFCISHCMSVIVEHINVLENISLENNRASQYNFILFYQG